MEVGYVYVPGNLPNKPFLTGVLVSLLILCMNLIQNVLGSGTWLEGGAYQQTNLRDTVMKAGVVGTYRYSDTPAGNNMRIRVPLSHQAQSWWLNLDDLLGSDSY